VCCSEFVVFISTLAVAEPETDPPNRSPPSSNPMVAESPAVKDSDIAHDASRPAVVVTPSENVFVKTLAVPWASWIHLPTAGSGGALQTAL